MAYTTDATWVAGELVDATDLNTYLRDNMKWLSTDKPMYRGYNSATFALPAGAFTPVPMDSERFDNAAMHDTASNNTRMTAPSGAAGKYLFGGHAIGDGAGDSFTEMRLIVNATTSFAEMGHYQASNSHGGSISGMYALAVADYVTCDLFNADADTMGVSGNKSPECWALWLGF